MSSKIERLSFYERQYLQSFDLSAEQAYHLEMRRRHNRALHPWGIVDGLELCRGVLVPDTPEQFYIHPGMAIDAFGREIVLGQPFPLTAEELATQRIQLAGTYEVWIAYHRELSTPPRPGYRVCDLAEQWTRLRESARILLGNGLGVNPANAPTLTDELSDDPIAHPWPVYLGSLEVVLHQGQAIPNGIAKVPGRRSYVGLLAQRITAPAADPPPECAADFPDADLPISVAANLHAEKNLLVGPDFPIDPTLVEPPPADPANFPSAAGNLRLANLFVQQNLYASVAGKWLGLKEFVKSVLPEIRVGTLKLTPAPSPANPSNGTEVINLTSTLPLVSQASIAVAIAGIEWLSWDDFSVWLGDASTAIPVKLEVSAGAPTKKAGTNNSFDFPISWSIGPKSTPANPNDALLNVRSLTVSYTVVFLP